MLIIKDNVDLKELEKYNYYLTTVETETGDKKIYEKCIFDQDYNFFGETTVYTCFIEIDLDTREIKQNENGSYIKIDLNYIADIIFNLVEEMKK